MNIAKKKIYLEIPLKNFHITLDLVEERKLSILEKSLIYIIYENKDLESILKEIQINSKIIQQTLIDLLYKRIINISFEENIVELKERIKDFIEEKTLDEFFREIPLESKHLNLLYDLCGNLFDKNNPETINLLNKPEENSAKIIRLKHIDDLSVPKINQLSWVHFMPFIWRKNENYSIKEINFSEYTYERNYFYFPIETKINENSICGMIKPQIARNWLNFYYKQENISSNLCEYEEDFNISSLSNQIISILNQRSVENLFKHRINIFDSLNLIQEKLSKLSDIYIEKKSFEDILISHIGYIKSILILVIPQLKDLNKLKSLLSKCDYNNDIKIYILISKTNFKNNESTINSFNSGKFIVGKNIFFLKLRQNSYTNYLIVDADKCYFPVLKKPDDYSILNENLNFIVMQNGIIPVTIASYIFSQVYDFPEKEIKKLNQFFSKKGNDTSFISECNFLSNYQSEFNDKYEKWKEKSFDLIDEGELEALNQKLKTTINKLVDIPDVEILLAKDYESQIFHLFNICSKDYDIDIALDIIDPEYAKNTLELFKRFAKKTNITFLKNNQDQNDYRNMLNQRTQNLFADNHISLIFHEIGYIPTIFFAIDKDSLVISNFSPFLINREEYKNPGFFDFGIHIKSTKIRKLFRDITMF